MNSTAILRKFLIGGVFLSLFIPMVFLSGYFFPFITGKNLVFRGLVEVMTMLLLVLAIFYSSYYPKKTWILVLYSAFIFVLILSTFFSVDSYNSFWSNFERMEGLVTHLHLFAYFLVLVSVMKTERLWNWFFATSIGVSLIVSLYAVGQFLEKIKIFQSGDRLESTLGNSAYLAAYLLFHIFIIGYYLARNEIKNVYAKFALFGVLVFETIILFLTETRGAIVGMIGGLVVVALLNALCGEGKNKKIAVSFIALLILIGGTFFAFKDMSFIKEQRGLRRLSAISLTSDDVQARFTIWGMAIEGAKEKPILGWGLENFSVVFNKYYEPSLYNREPWFDRAHNVFLDWLISAGVLGLLAYLSLFASAIYYLVFDTTSKISFTARSFLVGALGAYFVQNIFVFDNITSYILFVSILAYVHHLHKESLWMKAKEIFETALDKFTFRKNLKIREVIVFFVVIVFVVIFYGAVIKPASVAKDLVVAINSVDAEKNPQKSFDLFNDIFEKDSMGVAEVREQFLRMSISVVQLSGIDEETINKYLDTATQQMHLQTKEHPYDARAHLFLGSFYNFFGLHDMALTYLDGAQGLSQKKQQIYLERAIAYTGKGDIQKAKDVLHEAYQMEEKNTDIILMYARSLVNIGNKKEARRVIAEYFDENKKQELLTSLGL